MVKFLRRLLGIEALEARIEELEKSQTYQNSGVDGVKHSDNVLDEWVNGAEDDK